MKSETFDIMRTLDNDFYAQVATSFSETRESAWAGWERLVHVFDEWSESAYNKNKDAQREGEQDTTIRLLDLAAGNGRFEAFLARALPQRTWHATCVDACTQLLDICRTQTNMLPPDTLRCTIVEADILHALEATAKKAGESGEASESHEASEASESREATKTNEAGKANAWSTPDTYDVVVSFGFMHHIYSAAMRRAFVELMVRCVRPGGIVALSCWSFAQNAELARKAEQQTRAALARPEMPAQLRTEAPAVALEEGDYLLGWQGELSHVRFCHSFTPREVDELARSAQPVARTLARYQADGRTGDLNEYLVLQKL